MKIGVLQNDAGMQAPDERLHWMESNARMHTSLDLLVFPELFSDLEVKYLNLDSARLNPLLSTQKMVGDYYGLY